MVKIGITGASGMLGKEINEMLSSSENYDLLLFDLPEYDINNSDVIKKIVDSSDIIVNCAAYTAVDKAEDEIKKCYQINSNSVKNLAETASFYGKYIIHISTDFVFGDITDSPLNEYSETNPLGIYGKSKLEGEELLADTSRNYSIIRIQWTYGKHGNNFISKVIDLSEEMDSFSVVTDQVGSPTATADVAKAIQCFIEKRPIGLFHFASRGYVSRFEVAKYILKTLKINKTINPCTSEKFPTPAKRPKNSKFDCSKIDKILDYERPTWDSSLNIFLKENYSKFLK